MDRGAFHGFARHMRSLEGGPASNCGRASVWRDTAASGTVLESVDSADDVIGFVRELRNYFDKLRPMEASWHGERRPFIYKDLTTTERVFVRHDAPKTTLQSCNLRRTIFGHQPWRKEFRRTCSRQKYNDFHQLFKVSLYYCR